MTLNFTLLYFAGAIYYRQHSKSIHEWASLKFFEISSIILKIYRVNIHNNEKHFFYVYLNKYYIYIYILPIIMDIANSKDQKIIIKIPIKLKMLQ